MFPLNRINNSLKFPSINIRTTSSLSIYHLFNNDKRRKDITTTITSTSLLSNITFLSSSTSTTQEQQISVEEPYSAKTGIKTAAFLGGMSLSETKKNQKIYFEKFIDA
jgi:predicted AAA+ superfamily ATPase